MLKPLTHRPWQRLKIRLGFGFNFLSYEASPHFPLLPRHLTCSDVPTPITFSLFLQLGGSFVLKIFTSFEPPSIALLYILHCTFSELRCCKPATSKPGNSEVALRQPACCPPIRQL